MSDFRIIFSDFASTEVTFQALTSKARARIYGGISCQVRKSQAPAFAAELELEGFTVEVV